jgi:hypothetical protein
MMDAVSLSETSNYLYDTVYHIIPGIALIMEAVSISETSVYYEIMQQSIPELAMMMDAVSVSETSIYSIRLHITVAQGLL